MKSLPLTFSATTKRQTYIFIFLVLLILVPSVEIATGNINSYFSADAFAIYTGSIFTLWIVPALVTRFVSIKAGYITFIIFTIAWTIGASSTEKNKEVQSSIAKSAGEILAVCNANKHLQDNFCSGYKFNEDVTQTCNTDIALLVPKDMRQELHKAFSSNSSKKMISDLIVKIDQNIADVKNMKTATDNEICSQIDNFTYSAYLKAKQNIATEIKNY